MILYINRSQRLPSSQSYINGSTTHQYASGLGQIVHLAGAAENSRRLEAGRRLQADQQLGRRRRATTGGRGGDGGGSELLLTAAAVLSQPSIPGLPSQTCRACPGRIGIIYLFFKSKTGILLGYPYLSRIWCIGVSATS